MTALVSVWPGSLADTIPSSSIVIRCMVVCNKPGGGTCIDEVVSFGKCRHDSPIGFLQGYDGIRSCEVRLPMRHDVWVTSEDPESGVDVN